MIGIRYKGAAIGEVLVGRTSFAIQFPYRVLEKLLVFKANLSSMSRGRTWQLLNFFPHSFLYFPKGNIILVLKEYQKIIYKFLIRQERKHLMFFLFSESALMW